MHWKSALKPTLPNLTSPMTMDKGFKCANVCFIATVEKGYYKTRYYIFDQNYFVIEINNITQGFIILFKR